MGAFSSEAGILFLGGGTFSVASCGLNAIFYSEGFEDPFCRFFRVIAGEFAFCFLECLEGGFMVSYCMRFVVAVVMCSGMG